MNKRFLVANTIVLLMGLFLTTAAFSKDDVFLKKIDTLKQKKGVEGWNPYFTVGGTVNFSHSRKVIGQLDGQSWTLGGMIDTGVDYNHGPHQWLTNLSILDSFTYAPPINEFVKATDDFVFHSEYYYRIPSAKWLGPYADFKLETSIFEGTDVRSDYNNTWVLDGKVIHKGKRFKLTESFQPLTLKEVVGLFARPFSSKAFQWQFTAGFGSYQISEDGQLALNDNSATTAIEVMKLKSYTQAGAEIGTEIKGLVLKDRLTYKAYTNAMFPFVRTGDSGNRSVVELTNIEIGAKLSVKIFSWASLDYEFKAVRQPQMLDAFQIQNNLLLTFKYTPVKKRTTADKKKTAKK